MILTLHILDPIHLCAVTLIKSVDNAESFSLTISHHIGSAQFLLKFFVFWAQINLLVSFYTPHSLCFTNCKIYREVKTDFLVPTIGEKKWKDHEFWNQTKPPSNPILSTALQSHTYPCCMIWSIKKTVFLLFVYPLPENCLLHLRPTHLTNYPT